MAEQPDLFEARKARDKGLAKVMTPNEVWAAAVFAWAAGLIGWHGMGEDLRHRATAAYGPPHHPNAWGAMVRRLVVAELIIETGEYRAPRDKKSHASRKPVYRSRR